MEVLVIIAVFIILTIIILYTIYHNINITLCKGINTSMAKLRSIDNDRFLDLPLGDFYVKSAYNCCLAGEPTNSFVSVCALETCIKQGYRFLD